MLFKGKPPAFTLSLIHYLRQLSLVIEEAFSALFLWKWNVLTTIDLHFFENSAQWLEIIRGILAAPALPAGYGSRKKLNFPEGIFLLICFADQFGLEGEPVQIQRSKVTAQLVLCIK